MNKYYYFQDNVKIIFFVILFKRTDWLCKVVELSMQYCRQILQNLFETYKTIERSVNPEFERKVDIQNS